MCGGFRYGVSLVRRLGFTKIVGLFLDMLIACSSPSIAYNLLVGYFLFLFFLDFTLVVLSAHDNLIIGKNSSV